MQANDLRRGTAIIYEKEIYIVTDFRHYTPGNKRGFVQATMKNLKTGRLVQNKFSSDEDLDRAVLDPKPCQYLYHDEQGFHFMDMEDYHSFVMSDELLGEGKFYLKDNMELKVQFHGDNAVVPEFPKSVVLKVVESPPWIKGDSVSNNLKPAVCETGLKVQVPLFIDEGTEIRINTETGEYGGRA